jgi:outer membrane protein OmpA-like peptidoglycan-associated protein
VAAALRRAGMPANKILVEAMSDNRPAYLEVMPEGERLNRRTEVYISY